MCAARTWGSPLILRISWWWWSELLQRRRCRFLNPARYSFSFCLLLFMSRDKHYDGFFSLPQGYQVSLKSTHGPIDVFLCPEDSSGGCSPVTGSSPLKPNGDVSLALPLQSTDQSQDRTTTPSLEVDLSSPASTSSTVTAASQQDPSSLGLGADAGQRSFI